MIDQKISSNIEYAIPEFIRDDHRAFVDFVKAYIEFNEESGNPLEFIERFKRNLDVDDADEDFLDAYLNDFAKKFPKSNIVDKPTLLKSIKEFYLANGSPDAYKYLFAMIYNTSVDVIYPREQLYVPSSGDYTSDDVMYITGDNFFKLNINNEDLIASVTGATFGAQAILDTITSVIRIDGKLILQLELSSYEENFVIGESVLLEVNGVQVLENLLGTINSVKILDGGTNYTLDDKITVTDTEGRGTIVSIGQLDKGPYTTTEIELAGTGYEVGDPIRAENIVERGGYGFLAYVYEVDSGGEILKIRIEDGGRDYSKLTKGVISSTNGTGASIKLNGPNIGRIKALVVDSGGYNFQSTTNISTSVDTVDGVGLSVEPVLSFVFNKPKVYLDDKSTPSGNSKLLDSKYYQLFSYILASDISPTEWYGQVKELSHPAGSELIGMYKIDHEFHIPVTIPVNVDTVLRTNKDFINSVIIDSISLANSLIQLEQNAELNLIHSNTKDLDYIKFYDNLDLDIGDYADESISTITKDKYMKEYESTLIEII